jgi:hypothetical protein
LLHFISPFPSKEGAESKKHGGNGTELHVFRFVSDLLYKLNKGQEGKAQALTTFPKSFI